MFEVYIPRSKEPRQKNLPGIKISKQSIVLNKNARCLMQAEKLELAYDSNGVIRIRKTEGSGIALKKTKVYAKGFLEHFKIREKGQFPAEYKEEEQALYVKVK